MKPARPARSRSRGLAILAAAILPLFLASCAAAAAGDLDPRELRAAADSNLLESPTEQRYEVVELLPVSSSNQFLDTTVAKHLDYSGSMVLNDGIITSAELSLSVAHLVHASFVLTEPAVLRPDEGEDASVYAVGTLTVNGTARPRTSLELVPTELSEEAAAFDVDFAVPDNPFLNDGAPVDKLSAHVSLAARP